MTGLLVTLVEFQSSNADFTDALRLPVSAMLRAWPLCVVKIVFVISSWQQCFIHSLWSIILPWFMSHSFSWPAGVCWKPTLIQHQLMSWLFLQCTSVPSCRREHINLWSTVFEPNTTCLTKLELTRPCSTSWAYTFWGNIVLGLLETCQCVARCPGLYKPK